MVFPLIVKGQREAAKLNNHMPQISKLTSRMNEAKQAGNKFECKFVAFADVYISSQEYRITIALWEKYYFLDLSCCHLSLCTYALVDLYAAFNKLSEARACLLHHILNKKCGV